MDKKRNNSIFKNFDALSSNVIIEDFNSAKKFLDELKIDTDDISTQGTQEYKKVLFLAKANANRIHDLSLLKKLQDKIKESLARNATMTGEILKNALGERKASFQFRKLEEWSEEELRDVLCDLDMTKLLEDLENLEDR